MKQQLTSQDTPKIVLVSGLLLALASGGWLVAHKAAIGREETRMAEQMDREAELPAKINASSAAEESATGARDENDPEKQLLVRQ
jgi:hypothetical protein